jgi:hypothetical protein
MLHHIGGIFEVFRNAGFSHNGASEISEMANQIDEERSGIWLNIFKEGITSLLGLAILGFALYMLISVFNAAGRVSTGEAEAKAMQDAFGRQKDILLYALSLLGTVLGYYFGRVPAELHAQQAQNRANKAQGESEQARTEASQANAEKKVQADDFKRTLSIVRDALDQPDSPPTLSLRAPRKETGVEQAKAEVEEALKSYFP